MSHVFVSYSHEDAHFAHDVIHHIEESRIGGWIDSKDLRPGTNWIASIDDAIEGCFAVLVIMSAASLSSKYVTYEWAFAMGLGKKVIPIHIQQLSPQEMHPRLSVVQYLDFSSGHRWSDLLDYLRQAQNKTGARASHSKSIAIEQAKNALDSLKTVERRDAIDSLGEMKSNEEARRILIEALDHDMDDVKIRAALKVAYIPTASTHAIPVLLKALQQDDEGVRHDAARALAHIGAPAVPGLITMARTGQREQTRLVDDILAKIGPDAVPWLLDLRAEDNFSVKGRANLALINMGEKIVPLLLRYLRDDNRKIRDAAADTLGVMGRTSDAAISGLIDALLDRDSHVRVLAVRELGDIGSEFAINPLITTLLKDSDRLVRHQAADSLGRIGDGYAVPSLIKALLDQDAQVHHACIKALSEIGEPAIAPLMKTLAESNREVAEAAAEALGRIGTPTLIPIVNVLSNKDKQYNRQARELAASVLGRIRDDLSAQALLKTLNEDDTVVRRAASKALGKMGKVALPGVLQTLAKGKPERVRALAAEIAGMIKDADAVDALKHALKDRMEVALAALTALGRIGNPAAVQILVHTLEHENNAEKRSQAASALVMVGLPAVRDLERVLAQNRRKEVKQSAAWALGAIGSPGSKAVLLKALESKPSNGLKKEIETSLERLNEHH
jgi:HEAT repeat protein